MSPTVLIVGGGVAGLEAALALQALAGDLVRVEIVTPETDFAYRPLAVTEPFRAGEVRRFPLRDLVEAAGAALRSGRVEAVDPVRHVVTSEELGELPYDLLVLALGARSYPAVPGALTFVADDAGALGRLLVELDRGDARSVAFALPAGPAMLLPLYELALLTGAHLAERGIQIRTLTVVTPEEAPLGVLGRSASEAVRELLELRGIGLLTRTTPLAVEGSSLRVAPGPPLAADRVVALPGLRGPSLPGLPHDGQGFLLTGEDGRVLGVDDVYAAGDATAFPVKQGGIATQQADAVATAIAAALGADVPPAPFRPVLRALLVTGIAPRYLRAGGGASSSRVDTQPLWWPPAKVVGRYLSPFLAEHLGLAEEGRPPAAGEGAYAVEFGLDPARPGVWSPI